MAAKLYKFITFKMDEFTANFAFEVKMLFAGITVFSRIFKAGCRTVINKIFLNFTF